MIFGKDRMSAFWMATTPAAAAADPVSGPLETRVATAAQATPEARGGGSFADPTEAGPDAGLLDRLVAFTGRAL